MEKIYHDSESRYVKEYVFYSGSGSGGVLYSDKGVTEATVSEVKQALRAGHISVYGIMGTPAGTFVAGEYAMTPINVIFDEVTNTYYLISIAASLYYSSDEVSGAKSSMLYFKLANDAE